MIETDKKIELRIQSDATHMNAILKQHGQKKVSKSERTVDFNVNRKTTARDFIWHLKRVHHWWNCAGKDNNTPPLAIEFK